jgi:hypothetical protein
LPTKSKAKEFLSGKKSQLAESVLLILAVRVDFNVHSTPHPITLLLELGSIDLE